MIGRKPHIKKMHRLLQSKQSEFLALTGRRRVGKTYLIDQIYKKNICFSITGIQNGTYKEQLLNFSNKLAQYTKSPFITSIETWQIAFIQLTKYLKSLPANKKHVIFLDELPWINTTRSKFLQFLAHFWNDYVSKQSNFILVICGSASSWLVKKVINDKGGLHNRITEVIKLKPFTISETKSFLESKKLNFSKSGIVQLYMAMGGIPYYLENINKGESVNTAIERICFSENGILKQEYNNLYKALFENAKLHESIIKALATSKQGLSRKEIISKSKVKSGGPYDRTMEELIVCGFVEEYIPYGKNKKGSLYRLLDEYSVFYHRFIKPNKKYSKGLWSTIMNSQSYKIWSGYAFEAICMRHVDEIKQALNIGAVYTEFSSFRKVADKNSKGFQIDLIIDRQDQAINICEIKYYTSKFKVTKSYAEELEERKLLFREATKTKKQIFTTLITNQPIISNQYLLQSIDEHLNIEDFLFS